MDELFSDEIKSKERIDTKISAMNKFLKSHRFKTYVAPRAIVMIPLPVPVQTDNKGWKKSGKVGTRGGIIAKVTFKAYQKEYSVADADKRFTFVQIQDGVKL